MGESGTDVDPAARLRIDLLGPVGVRRGEAPLDSGPVRRQAVLAALALRDGTLITRQQLLDDVWGTEPPGTGHRVLPSYVYPLRKVLDASGTATARSVIRGERGGYRFVAGAARTDVAELTERTAEGRRAKAAGSIDTALELYSRALELFRGEPLAGLPGPFAEAERQRLAQHRRALQQERAECLVLLGRFADALDCLAASAVSQPYDEALAALRMRALYGSGRQAEALAFYQDMRHRLLEELGLEPGEELRRIHQGVLRRDDALLLGVGVGAGAGAGARAGAAGPPSAVGAAARPRRPRVDLPGDTACLVGREAELALLTAPVPDGAVSVAAVDGTAGVGKTALVVRAGWTLHGQYPDGCLFVDLRSHDGAQESVGPRRALRRLLRAVGSDADSLPDDLDELVGAWRAATSALRLLLVVDDARSAEQVRPLLPAGPGSRVLVAGRGRLPDLDADLHLTVEPLGTAAAVELLRQLLGEERADSEPQAARELARRCGGLPLALRITGARLQHRPAWTMAHLAGRMPDDEHGLDELRAGDRSVEAAFRLSYDQLPPELRRAFRTVGTAPTYAFDGLTPAVMLGCSREAAEDLMERLVDASLLQQPRPDRYRPHDLVRAHARRLAEAAPEEAAADRAAVLRLYVAAGRGAGEWGPGGFPTGPAGLGTPFGDWRAAAAWLEAAGAELVDVVAYAVAAGEYDHACWIAESLVDHLVRQGRSHESRAALELVLPYAEMSTDRRMPASLRNCLGVTDIHGGRLRQARAWFADALHRAGSHGDPLDRARAIAGLGIVEWPLGHTEEAVAHLNQAAELATGLDDNWLAGMVVCNLGGIHGRQGRHEQAFEHYDTALAFAEKNGRPGLIARFLCFAADAQLALGRHAEAASLVGRAAELARDAGEEELRTVTLTRLGTVEHGRGHLSRAVDLHREALSTLTERTSTWLEMDVRIRLGQSYAAAGRRAEARQQFRDALALPGADAHVPAFGAALDGLNTC
ncbi:BTAD domain-containing putative transcriptional regulator [Streptomyces sp. NPDC056470]|uniref:AfsR/SARP family transcriptional regulator n=1 Tax=Streptomyces sp. NPDC056470 TaxID=3345831 RepID=UPI0036AB8446